MQEIFVKVSDNMEVKLPIMPNFIQTKIGNTSKIQLGIGDLNDNQIAIMADAYKNELLAHAKRKRSNRVT
jgi:hypothetical protein